MKQEDVLVCNVPPIVEECVYYSISVTNQDRLS